MENIIKTFPIIDINEFIDITKKLDIRYGTITTVQDIPKSEQMYNLTVDFGSETRTILSKIKTLITKEKLLGKQYPFILNMPSRKMLGIVSDGMIILPNNDSHEPYLDGEFPNGVKLF